MTFKVGDDVVYPSQGAGTIEETTTREVLGVQHEYLKIVFISGDMEVLVPLKKGQEVGLRLTIGKDEVEQLHDTILKADLSLPNQWPPRFRAEQDIISSGNAYDLAKLLGVLYQRDLDKGLAATEREIMEKAKDMLASELAVVQKAKLGTTRQNLDQFLADNISLS